MKEKFLKFLTGKSITKEQFEAKTAEEMAALYNEFNDLERAELETAIAGKASKEDIDALKESIVANQAEQMKSLNETLKQYGIAIKKLTEQEKATGAETGSIRKGLEAHLDKLRLMAKGDKEIIKANEFSFKVAGDMTNAGNISGGNIPVEQRIPGLNMLRSRRVRLMDIVTVGTASSNVISWVFQANKDGAAGGTAEGVTKNQIDFDLVVASESVKKRTAYIKVSTEMLNDIDFMESEIRNELMRELMKDIEKQVYQGDAAGSNLRGIRTVATAFAAGTFALTVDNANEADVLTVAINQVMLAEHDMPNFILMHPSDVTKLKLYKVSTTDRRYIDRLTLIAGQLTLDGVPIIPTTLIAVTEYLVGNFDLATLFSRGEIGVNIGLDGNDFTKNMVTVLAEWRGLLIVKNNDRTAFIKGDFDPDKLALETV